VLRQRAVASHESSHHHNARPCWRPIHAMMEQQRAPHQHEPCKCVVDVIFNVTAKLQ